MEKILLFYKYVYLDAPEAIMQWQKELCTSLGLKGRIILAHEGINGTLGGAVEATGAYKKAMNEHPFFSHIDFKEGDGGAYNFPRLRIVVKDEIVRMNVDPKAITAQQGGKHLSPQQAHELITESSDNLVILDARNTYESSIGTFKDAVTPAIQNFREFPEYIDEHQDLFKDKKVLMFCTGGIRCERASAYLKIKGVAEEVYQIEGGIHRYIEAYPDGYFRGKNYVFDSRIAVKVTDDIIGACALCHTSYDEYTNCFNVLCNKQIILCPSCMVDYGNACGGVCRDLVQSGRVKVRTIPKRNFCHVS